MKSFGQKAWVLPQPVLIIGTYNSDGTPNAMNAAWGGQWDSKEIMISMGAHATTENLARCNEFTVARFHYSIIPRGVYNFVIRVRIFPHKGHVFSVKQF